LARSRHRVRHRRVRDERGKVFTLSETCQKLGIDPERVRARADELRNS
jgi:DNA-directed RNA polymerase sigma subunit (sigma70/sigma32)